MISDDIALSRAMADAVGRSPELQLVTQELSITTFRYVPGDLKKRIGEDGVEAHLDALNRSLLDRIQRGGGTRSSPNAVVNAALRAARMYRELHSRLADVEAVPALAVRLGRALDLESRPAALR